MSLFESGFSLPAVVTSEISSRKRKRASDDGASQDALVSAAAGIDVQKLLDKLRAKEGDSSREKPEKRGKSNGNTAQTNGTLLSKAEKRRRKAAAAQSNGETPAPSPALPAEKVAVHDSAGLEPARWTDVAERPASQPTKKRKKKQRAQDGAQDAQVGPSGRKSALLMNEETSGSSLRDQLREKLGGSRFRYINEQLYTISGDDAQKLMDEDGNLFTEYHVGFSGQAKRWPTNPLSIIIEALATRPARTTVADLGCGEAELAKALLGHGIRVFSFDLVGNGETVIKAQCSRHVPLPNDTMDVVVCCLSLMGQDWLGMIREARRILVPGGVLKIAEVRSRFKDVNAFSEIIERAGFLSTSMDPRNSHFILFDFEAFEQARLQAGDEERASTLLAPCIYKKR